MGLLIFWMFQPKGPEEITWKQFEQLILASGDVERLDVVNNERVEVYVVPDSLKESQYKKLSKGRYDGQAYQGPQFFFNIGSVEVFDQQLEEAEKKREIADGVSVTYNKRTNWWTGVKKDLNWQK